MRFRKSFFFLLLLISVNAFAQVNLKIPLNIEEAYRKGTRTATAEPGKNYWQNTANYTIYVNFNPDTRLLEGNVDISYCNNSPDTLKQIWFKLYPNLYKKGSPGDSKIAVSNLSNGVRISGIIINQKETDTSKLMIDGTNMVVPVAPLLPHQSMKFNISYSYEVNKGSHIRTGQVDDGSFFIAYFFPRIAVYDDIDGWNKDPYLGSAEFYNDFCTFNAEITVPRKYVVWGTGDLLNQDKVFSPRINRRILEVEKNDSVTTIISSGDVEKDDITTTVNTWKFKAANVTDFVFALSNHYVWKASSLIVDKSTGRRTRVDAVFNPKHKDFDEVVNYARKTVESMSYVFPKWPFPYPHETVFDGLDQMEYPMLVNDNPLEDKKSTITLTDHEIFHTMFPFYMGINETKYGWMDEGWATLAEWLISPMIDSTIVDEYGVLPYERFAGREADSPVVTLTTQESGTPFYLNSYPKPAFGYLFVKDMLGDKLFTKALHHYIENWKGKHPGPYDFFNSMNTGAGMNLNWFWKAWFFDNGVPDLAIKKVIRNGNTYQVLVESKGTKPVPVDLTVKYKDGSETKIHRSIAVWRCENKIIVPFTSAKTVKEITLGSTYTPDVHKADNKYRMR